MAMDIIHYFINKCMVCPVYARGAEMNRYYHYP